MRLAALLALGLLLPAPVFAHGTAGGVGWSIDLWSAVPLALSAGLYLVGFRRWRRRRAVLFWMGWAVVALEDQQLAGLIMWVPGALVCVGVALALVARWLRQAGARA
ncbi:cytochrome c oxidase assembly protein [Azospirillum sp. sgz302134]